MSCLAVLLAKDPDRHQHREWTRKLTKGLKVENGDWSRFRIISEDAEVKYWPHPRISSE